MSYELYILPLLFLLYLMHLKFFTCKRGYGRYRKLFVLLRVVQWLHNHVFYNKPYVLPMDSLIGIYACSWRWCSHCSLVWLSSYCMQLLTTALSFPPEVIFPLALMA